MRQLWGLLLFILIAGASWAQTGMTDDLQAAVTAGNQAWVDGMQNGDANAIGAAYAIGAVSCGINGDCVSGRGAIEQQFRSRVASSGRARSASLTTSSIVRDRDLAYEWGFTEARFASGNVLRQRYLSVWQRQPDGAWKILRNLALPVSGGFREFGREAAPASSTLRCESDDMGYHTCVAQADITRADVERQISGSPCTLNQTWGWKGNAIWVNRGCRAEFRVYSYAPRQEPAVEYNDDRAKTTTLKCESEDMNYKFCPSQAPIQGARMVRQISGSACTETRTWGWKTDGVWVNKGCRAEFQVTTK